jgi:arabinose-5-phosphate isomerase
MADALPADFDAAVDAILATRGRVILGGIGKSGHIARKISSTLASTGTPSAFVHAAEASHGDLGMITPGDLVILISKSGETSELSDIVAHVTRFSIPLIGISGKDTSALMQAADYRLDPALRAGGLRAGHGADHVHHADAGAGRCAGRSGDGTARVPA